MEIDTTTETPEQIAFYKTEIDRMIATMDASEERRQQQQTRIDELKTKTRATLVAIQERLK